MPTWLVVVLALFGALSTLVSMSIGVTVFLTSRFQSKAAAELNNQTNLRITRLEDRAWSPERQRQLEDRVVKLETLLTLYERQTDKILRGAVS